MSVGASYQYVYAVVTSSILNLRIPRRDCYWVEKLPKCIYFFFLQIHNYHVILHVVYNNNVKTICKITLVVYSPK